MNKKMNKNPKSKSRWQNSKEIISKGAKDTCLTVTGCSPLYFSIGYQTVFDSDTLRCFFIFCLMKIFAQKHEEMTINS